MYHGFTYDITPMEVDMHTLLKREIPGGFLVDCILELVRIYDKVFKIAHENLELSGSQAKWAIPYLRRGMTEGAIKKVARDHGLKFTERKNSKGTWGGNCPQVEIESGLFKLLFHAVDGPSRKVRRSRRRASLASRQGLLFSLAELHPDLEEGQIFGIILHGPDSPRLGETYESLSRVGFVSLGFPSPEFVYLHPPIDLLKYCNMEELYSEIKEEPIEDKAHPETKEIQIKKKK